MSVRSAILIDRFLPTQELRYLFITIYLLQFITILKVFVRLEPTNLTTPQSVVLNLINNYVMRVTYLYPIPALLSHFLNKE